MSFSGPQHWREADLILTGDADPCSYGCPHTGCPHEMAMIARAIAHGLLALSATQVDGAAVMRPADRHEWLKATDPEYAAEQAAQVDAVTGSEHVTPRVHIGCGGAVLWDLSGGYCTRCHAENLEPDEAERGPAVTP
jgi:cytochrome c1